MGKLRLSVQRKNERRKKYGFLPVHIPLRKDISFLTVKISLDGLSYTASLPLTTFHSAPASSYLQGRIKAAGVIPEGTMSCNHNYTVITTPTNYFVKLITHSD